MVSVACGSRHTFEKPVDDIVYVDLGRLIVRHIALYQFCCVSICLRYGEDIVCAPASILC